MERDKTNIIITGTGKGIGFELVKLFAATENKNIIAISRNIENINAFNENNSGKHLSKVFPIPFDLNSDEYDAKLLPLILKITDKIDILINNAGALINKPMLQQTEEDFDQQFNVNIKAVFKLSKLMIPHLNKNAHIVNISSMGGFQGSAKFKGLSLYSASKGALAIFTECLAEELKESGIKANCLALGATQTEMLAKAFPKYEAPISAKDMATYIAEFALHAHQFMNGKIIPVSITTP